MSLICCLMLVALWSVSTCIAGGQEEPLVLKVWPGETIGDYGDIGPERFRTPEEAPTSNALWLTNVTRPTITVYRPQKEKDTGAAAIVCPGGGYWNLAWDLEGTEVAAWLTSVGMTGIVLKYRVPRRPGQPERLPAPLPLLDAQRAISLTRSRAGEWGIDPDRLGIVGFSAGGHLALAAATHFDQRAYDPIDEVDAFNCRPDFAVPVYPGYFSLQEPGVLESYIRIPAGTPPVMLVHASDDTISDCENSVAMYVGLKRAGISAELHVYASGEHGFGVRRKAAPCTAWTDRCVEWLQSQGVLKQGI